MSKKYGTFNIIKHHNTPKVATLYEGTKVSRQTELWIKEQNRMISCALYDNHFIYTVPDHIYLKEEGSHYMCTCGSPAVWVGPSGYNFGATGQKLMMVCMVYTEWSVSYGKGAHADGSS